MAKQAKRPQKPEQVTIKPQRMDFDFQAVPGHWFDNEPVMTHFLNALSLTFPEGERFFVDSVRALRKKVKDKKRQEDISGFIGQEAMHSLEHRTFNAMLEAQGFKKQAKGGEALALRFLNGGRKRLSKRQQLAATAGLEHITAILANLLLKEGGLVETMDDSVRDLWVWHAIEETEHKAVAYDLYLDVPGSNYAERVALFLGSTAFLAFYTVVYTNAFLVADGAWKHPFKVLRGIAKTTRHLLPVIPEYLDYLRPGFHPWDDENSHLIEKWRSALEKYNGEAQAA